MNKVKFIILLLIIDIIFSNIFLNIPLFGKTQIGENLQKKMILIF